MLRFRAIVGAVVLLGAGEALAQEASTSGSARLSWVRAEGAESCVDGTALSRDVAARLGRDPFALDAAQSIEGLVRRDGDRWTARLFLRDASGAATDTREIVHVGASCEPLRAAMALAIAVAIDPEAALREPVPVAPTPVVPVVAAPVVALAAPRPRRSRRPPPSLSFGGSVRASLALGALPSAAGGATLAFDVRGRAPFLVSLSARILPEQIAPAPNGNVRFGLSSASLRGCYEPLRGDRVFVAVCAGLQLGLLHAVVFDTEPIAPGERVLVAAELTARAHLRLVGPLSLIAELGPAVHIQRYRFFIQGSGRTVYEQPSASGFGEIGLSLHFP